MNCNICGVDATDDKEHYTHIVCDLCYTCWFWSDIIAHQSERCIVVDNEHYCIGEGIKLPGHLLGFGGREFYIRKANGEVVRTNNLWHQGEVPERFRAQLPNNAKFISMEENDNA